MEIKSKIIEILEKEHYTFSDLAGYLHMSEDDLTQALNNRTLELRSLDSGPYNQKLSDFFVDKEEEMEKSGKNEYVLTTDEVKDFTEAKIKIVSLSPDRADTICE